MRVIIKKLGLKGFLSVGEATIDFNNKGICLVEGVNNSQGNPSSNGSGKSTIFEGIIYALTGSTMRGTTDVINLYDPDKYCSVRLTIQVDNTEYVILRTRNHPEHGNNLKLYRNDEDISGDKLRKSEKILEQELPTLTSSLISSVIILGQGMPNRFSGLKPASRKTRLEELSQCSEFINELKARLVVKSKSTEKLFNQCKCDESGCLTGLSICKDTIKRKSDELVRLASSTDTNQSLSEEIATVQSQYDELQKHIQSFYPDKIELLQNKLSQLNMTLQSNNQSLATNQSEYNNLQLQYNQLATSTCPTCKQVITSQATIDELRTKLSTSMTDISTKVSELNQSNTSVLGIKSALEPKLQQLVTSKSQDESKCNGLLRQLTELTAKLESSKVQSESIKTELNDLKSSLVTSESQLQSVRQDIVKHTRKLDIVKYLTKQSSKEFRGYLLKGVINYLNSKISYYGKELFGTSTLSLQLEGNGISIKYDNRPYENLSGGERQRADLAMQFSLRDMLLNNLGFSSNLLVIDEGFDNLDESGVNSLIRLITNLSGIESIAIVTHHADLPIPYDSKLLVNKGMNNLSTIEEVHN